MARRRTRSARSRQMGRQGLWIRYQAFSPSDVVTAPKLTEDALIYPDLWEREISDLTQPKRGKGGALLKRCFGTCRWEIRETTAVNTVIIPGYEVLIFAAATTEPAATASTDFEDALTTQRILHYSMTGPRVAADFGGTEDRFRWWADLNFDVKVSAKLPGQDIVVMTRCSETETADVDIDVRLQFSAYITTP